MKRKSRENPPRSRKTLKTAIPPKSWNDLPPELKLKCMEELDYQSSASLSSVARAELSIYEGSAKFKNFKWNTVQIYYNIDYDTKELENFSVFAYAEDQEIEMSCLKGRPSPSFDKVLSLLAHVLKHSQLEKLRFESEGGVASMPPEFFARLQKCAPFRVNEFWSHHNPPDAPKFLLKNCERAPEIVQFFEYCGQVGRVFYQMIRMENFLLANHIKLIVEKPKLKMFATIAEKWIEFDAKIGTQLFNSAHTPFRLFLNYFHRKFENRVHKRTMLAVRIRTDTPGKHIVLSEEYEGGQYMCVVGSRQRAPQWGEIYDEEGHYFQGF